MRIAVDALGGDNAPAQVVAGAVSAARKLPRDEILLVGKPSAVESELGSDAPSNVCLRPAGDAVGMDEEPSEVLRRRRDASVAVAAEMVGEGEAEALFTAGNTGAAVAGALLRIGRLKGCRRPAIATVLPFPSPVLLLDVGATVSCRPQDLLNFAILGAVFAERYFGLDGAARGGLDQRRRGAGEGVRPGQKGACLDLGLWGTLRRQRRGKRLGVRGGRRARDRRVHRQRRS
jgi:glycerol-3-phosphate acyltransferase PlsX